MREFQSGPARGAAPDRTLADDLLPTGSRGEHILQQLQDSQTEYGQFYRHQVTDQLTQEMVEFVEADGGGVHRHERVRRLRLQLPGPGRPGSCGCSTRARSPIPSSAAMA